MITLKEKQFKDLLKGNNLGFQRSAGGIVPSDPDEKIKQSKGLRAAFAVMVEGRTVAEAARDNDITPQGVRYIIGQITSKYASSEGVVTMKIQLPAKHKEALEAFLEEIGGQKI